MSDRSTVAYVPSVHGAALSSVEVQGSTILVPLNGSVRALAALPVARTLAEVMHATLHLVHIADHIIPPRELLHKLALTANDVRGSVVEQAPGDAGVSLVRLTREPACAYVVMCPHTGQAERVDDLSSVTRKVLRWSPCPVVLVPTAWKPQPWPLRHILVACDGKPATSATFGPAFDLAQRTGASLAVLHVTSAGVAPWSEPGSITAPRYVDQVQHEWPAWTHEFLHRACCAIRPEQLPALRLELAVGEPAAQIVRAAQVHQADLIALCWHCHMESAHPCVVRAVVRHAPCPVLMLRAKQAG